MVEILTIGWFIAFFCGVLGIIDSVLFFVILSKMAEHKGVRKSLFFFFLCSVVVITYSFITSYFGLVKLSIINIFWIIIPVGWIFVIVFFIIFVKKFLKGIEEI